MASLCQRGSPRRAMAAIVRNHVELTHPLHAYMTAMGTRQSDAMLALRKATVKETGRAWGMISAPETAGLLAWLVHLVDAKRVLEVGTVRLHTLCESFTPTS